VTESPVGGIAGVKLDVVVRIVGGPGDGVGAAGQILARAAVLAGFHVLAYESRPAEIRGFGKTIAHVRISEILHSTPRQNADILMSLHDGHAIPELAGLGDHGVIFYDSKPRDFVAEDQAIAGFVAPGRAGYGVPLRELSERVMGGAKMRHLVALGALAAMHRMTRDPFHQSIRRRFARRPERYRQESRSAFDLGFDFAQKHLTKVDPIDFDFQARERQEQSLLLSGNEAVAQACIDARIRLFAAHPAAPANPIAEILARELPALGGQVLQAEDDVAAIAHALGAGFAGHVAVTATSGPGLSQMTELLGLAVAAEVPLLVIDCQRGGPSVGLPTRTEQSDLALAVGGGHGDCPRPVLAPADVSESYCLTTAALRIATAFQTPAVLLLDAFLASRLEDIPWKPSTPFCGFREPAPLPLPAPGEYRRYALTHSGLSPASVPGQAGYAFVATGMAHDEYGRPDDSGPNHEAMTAKRHRKLERLAELWPAPETVGGDGPLELGLIAWGPVIGAAREALAALSGQGIAAGGCFPRLIWPVQVAPLREFARRCRVLAVVELNFGGQYANLVQLATGREVSRLARLTGEPLSPEWLVAAVEQTGATGAGCEETR